MHTSVLRLALLFFILPLMHHFLLMFPIFWIYTSTEVKNETTFTILVLLLFVSLVLSPYLYLLLTLVDKNIPLFNYVPTASCTIACLN